MDPNRTTTWQPVLDVELRARADGAVTAIAEALAETPIAPDPSLSHGSPGIALLFAYLARARPGQGHEERASQLLDAAIDRVAEEALDASLFAGFTGVAWTSEHLGAQANGETDDPNQEIDEVLQRLLAQSPWRDDHDLVSGLAGLAVYGLERLPRPSARLCLELVLDRLEETAERGGGRATWKTPAERLDPRVSQTYPQGNYDVGVAHGVPGVVTILAAMVGAGIGGVRARGLLGEATSWVVDQRLADVPGSALFPNCVAPGVAPRVAGFGWCYGDPGIAAALLAAARAVGDAGLEGTAVAVARRAAAETTTRRDVTEAGLCHGAAGVAHLFNRIHQTTGDTACGDAARRWFARALDVREVDVGEGRGARGLMNGAAGIALALLGASSAVEPSWDRLLLASCRSAGASG